MKMQQFFQKHDTSTLAWIMWSALALAYLIVFFHRLSLSVVLDRLMVDLQIEDAAVMGTLAGSYAIIYVIMQIPTGLLADSWGSRKTVTTGMMVACAGSFIFALAPSLFYAFLGRGLVGLGVSVVFVSILKFQVSWFKPARFATITGLTGLAGNIGVALGTTPLALLVAGFGWRNSFLVISVATFFIALACWILVRNGPWEIKEEEEEEEQENIIQGDSTTFHSLTDALKNVLKNRRTWPILASAFGIYGTFFAFSGTWSITYLMQTYGLTRTAAANYMLALTIGMIIGLPLVGLISDRIGQRRRPLLLLFLLYTSLWAAFYVWNGGKPPLEALYPLFFLMGLSGGASSVILPMGKEVNDPAYAGIALSVINIGPFSGMAIMQPLLGYVLDLRWDGLIVAGTKVYPLAAYRGLFATCLLVLLACFAISLATRETGCQNVYKKTGKANFP